MKGKSMATKRTIRLEAWQRGQKTERAQVVAVVRKSNGQFGGTNTRVNALSAR
jgi:hypothetical protein